MTAAAANMAAGLLGSYTGAHEGRHAHPATRPRRSCQHRRRSVSGGLGRAASVGRWRDEQIEIARHRAEKVCILSGRCLRRSGRSGNDAQLVCRYFDCAVKSAILAGNPPERRVERLREFWDRVSAYAPLTPPAVLDPLRPFLDRLSVWSVATFGIPGFLSRACRPRSLLRRHRPDVC